jgi:hypothetical protein
VRYRRIHGAASGASRAPRRPEAAGVPRLRFGGRRRLAERHPPRGPRRGTPGSRGASGQSLCQGFGWATPLGHTGARRGGNPHRDASGRIIVIHNGIINFLPLRGAQAGDRPRRTDTEVVAQALGAARRPRRRSPSSARFGTLHGCASFSSRPTGRASTPQYGPPSSSARRTGRLRRLGRQPLPHTRPRLPRGWASHGSRGPDHTDSPARRGPPRGACRGVGRRRGLPFMAEIAEQPSVVAETVAQALARGRPLRRGGHGVPRAPRGRGADPRRGLRDELARIVGKFLLEDRPDPDRGRRLRFAARPRPP